MSRLTLIAYCLVVAIMSIVTLNNIDLWRPTQEELQVEQPAGHIFTPWQEPESTIDDALNSIKKNDLKEMVYFLSSTEIQSRAAGSNGCKKAANYIEATFKKSGLQTMRDPFQWGGYTTNNIYGWIKGKKFPNEIIIVGAHYDSVPSRYTRGLCPGADDNASGTAAVLELAKAFALLKEVNRTIVFQLYSAEEEGLWGSNHYCRNPKFPIESPSLDKHVFMMNFDMIGYLGRKTSFHRASRTITPTDDLIRQLSSKYPFAKSISFNGGEGSDHANFNRYSKGKINIVWFFTGTHENYHKATDTPDKLNYEGMEKITKYAFEMLYIISQK